jgi:hypothetical protein
VVKKTSNRADIPTGGYGVKNSWDEALRSLARKSQGPFRLLAYGVTGDARDEAALGADLQNLARQEPCDIGPRIVADVADPFAGAAHRPRFKDQVLAWISDRTPATTAPAQAQDRRQLEAIASQLAGFLDELGDGVTVRPHLRLLPEAPSKRAESCRIPVVLVRQFEDLGCDAEGIAAALEAVVVRGGHLRIVSEGIDTRTREGRAMATVALRVGGIKARRARERSLRDLHVRREGLRVYGPVPFGFTRLGQELVPISDQMESVARARELSRRGCSLLETALTLNRERRAWKDGTDWTWKRVRQVLLNPIYDRPLQGAGE